MTSRKDKPQSLEAFAEAEATAQFAENQELARASRTLRRTLAERDAELGELRKRIAVHEHPSLHRVERLLLQHASLTRDQLVEQLGVGTKVVDALLKDMAQKGYNVKQDVLSREGGGPRTTVEHFYGDEVRFGIVSDTHLGNRHALEEQLHEAYEVFRREGVTNVYCPGNLLDGEKTYRGQEYEITVMGADNVVANLARVWPRVTGITTHHVASSTCHEGYYLKSTGLLIGKLIERDRPDMKYLGLDEADIVVHEGPAKPVLRLIHPGGGSSYAHSYRPQKIVESYSGGEKPAILVIGHYHKSGYYDIRDVATFQAGCLERQTPFMRKLALEAHLGFWLIEARFTDDGSLRRISGEFFKYYVGRNGQILKRWA